jgi:hypothetical protein
MVWDHSVGGGNSAWLVFGVACNKQTNAIIASHCHRRDRESEEYGGIDLGVLNMAFSYQAVCLAAE